MIDKLPDRSAKGHCREGRVSAVPLWKLEVEEVDDVPAGLVGTVLLKGRSSVDITEVFCPTPASYL